MNPNVLILNNSFSSFSFHVSTLFLSVWKQPLNYKQYIKNSVKNRIQMKIVSSEPHLTRLDCMKEWILSFQPDDNRMVRTL